MSQDNPRAKHKARLKELARARRSRSLTEAEWREVATRCAALGDHWNAGLARAKADRRRARRRATVASAPPLAAVLASSPPAVCAGPPAFRPQPALPRSEAEQWHAFWTRNGIWAQPVAVQQDGRDVGRHRLVLLACLLAALVYWLLR